MSLTAQKLDTCYGCRGPRFNPLSLHRSLEHYWEQPLGTGSSPKHCQVIPGIKVEIMVVRKYNGYGTGIEILNVCNKSSQITL